jgi:hypothetical protein
MTLGRAISATALCTALATPLGALLGRALGYFAPGYYRSLFYRGHEPSFDPVDVGTGFGLNAGVFTGVVVGLVIVAIVTYYEVRTATRSQLGATPSAPLHPKEQRELDGGRSTAIRA